MSPQTLVLALAGWRIHLRCQPDRFAEAVSARYGVFLAEDEGGAPADLTADVRLDAGQVVLAELLPTTRLTGPVCTLDLPGADAQLRMDERRGDLVIRNNAALPSLEYFLRAACALLADASDDLMLHCAAATNARGAHLFVGHSGDGKSTASRLSAGRAVVLNDDLVVLRRENGRWMAYGTPFWNFETLDRGGQTAHGPVAGVYTLAKDPQVYLEPLPVAAAVAALFANCPVVNGDPGRTAALLARCRRLAQAVPVWRLHFRKDASFWDVLEAGTREE
jgi:hypothetical protein